MLFCSTIHLSPSYVWCSVHRQNFWPPIFIVPSASGPLLLIDFWIQWEWIWIWREWIWEQKGKNTFSLWQKSLNSIIMFRKDILFVRENFWSPTKLISYQVELKGGYDVIFGCGHYDVRSGRKQCKVRATYKHPTPGGVRGYKKSMPVDRP